MKPAFEDMSLQIPAATAEPEDYTGEDGLLYCGKCRTPKEAYKALTAENAALEKQLGASSKESVLKKLEINEKLRELDELHRMVDVLPPEILQAAKQVAAHKQQER